MVGFGSCRWLDNDFSLSGALEVDVGIRHAEIEVLVVGEAVFGIEGEGGVGQSLEPRAFDQLRVGGYQRQFEDKRGGGEQDVADSVLRQFDLAGAERDGEVERRFLEGHPFECLVNPRRKALFDFQAAFAFEMSGFPKGDRRKKELVFGAFELPS
jgi:hypothetical protein